MYDTLSSISQHVVFKYNIYECVVLDWRCPNKILKLILCGRWSVICLRTTDHHDTSPLVVWQHQYSVKLLQHTVMSNHAPTVERSPALFLFLSLPIRQRQTEITSLCNLSYRTNLEAKRNVFNNFPWKVVNIDWNVLYFICHLPRSPTEIKKLHCKKHLAEVADAHIQSHS